jgi:FkbM family methyltransferase
MNIVSVANKVLHAKGNLLSINFEVNGKLYNAFVPDDQLFVAIKDILLNREYEYLPEFELNRFEGKRVVDTGAHIGLFSLVASTFAKEVISIEPHPVNFKLLQLNLEINNARNIIPINKALWSESKTLTLYEGGHTGAHTIIKNLGNKKFNVSSISLGDIIDKFGEIDLLKMDIEGGEFEVSSKLDSKILENVRNIVAECHLEAGDISQLEKFLKENGYHTEKFTPPLVKKKAGYPIKVRNLTNLKIFRKFAYTLTTLVGARDTTLAILFARREK